MNPTILSEINAKNLSAYLTGRVFKKFYWTDFFPLTSTPFLTGKSIIGSKGAPVAADVVAYDTSAPQKSRKTVSTMEIDIPAIRISRKMSENDLNTYNVLKAMARGDSVLTQILKLVYEDVDFTFEGVLARLEWLALKALSYTRINLTKTTNDGIVTETTISFQPVNTAGAAVAWNGGATTITPITDIETMQTYMYNNYGIKMKHLLMNRTSLGYMKAATETKDFASFFTITGKTATISKRNPSLSVVNESLKDNDLPTIIPIDQSIITETADHAQTAANPWENGYVTGIPEIKVGEMLSGPIATETNKPKQITAAKKEGVLVYKYSETNPTSEMTVAEINAFPSFPLIDRCYNLYSLGTGWA